MPPKHKEAELEFKVKKELSQNEMEKQFKGLKGNSCSRSGKVCLSLGRNVELNNLQVKIHSYTRILH